MLQNQPTEFDCPICLQIIVEPTKLACAHLFCISCVTNLANIAMGNVKCPLCRKQQKDCEFKMDKQLQAMIREKYNQAFIQRMNLLLKSRDLSTCSFVLIYGNKYERVEPLKKPENIHYWTAFVKAENSFDQNHQNLNLNQPNSMIESVVMHIDESFEENKLFYYKAPFEISKRGWGTFEVKFVIRFIKQLGLKPITLFHELVFEGQGSSSMHKITVETKNLKLAHLIK